MGVDDVEAESHETVAGIENGNVVDLKTKNLTLFFFMIRNFTFYKVWTINWYLVHSNLEGNRRKEEGIRRGQFESKVCGKTVPQASTFEQE